MADQPNQASFPNRTANLLGALALAVVDRTAEARAEAAAQSESAAAALSALDHFLDAPSIDVLRQVLGLTHSGTVRLVDRLEQEGLVARRAGADRRSVAVTLTARGRRVAQRTTVARADVLNATLGVLSPAERETLDRLMGRMLVGMMRESGATRWICRMCDTNACGRYAGGCPIGRAVEARRLADELEEPE